MALIVVTALVHQTQQILIASVVLRHSACGSNAFVSLACYDMCRKGHLRGWKVIVTISDLREAFPNTKTSLSASSLPTGSAGRRGSHTEKRIQLAQPASNPVAI